MIKSNFHTHSTFCDGKNTPEEMVEVAIEKKIDILGFSSHSMYPFSSDWHIPSNSHEEYIREIIQNFKNETNKIVCAYLYDIQNTKYRSEIDNPIFSFSLSIFIILAFTV